MKIFRCVFLLTALNVKLFAQDTSVAWLKNIDTTAFQFYNDKKYIPEDFYKYMEIESLKDVANPSEEYISGCIGREGIPMKRLNWLATDNNNHIVMKISCGGKSHRVLYYFLDRDKKKLNINQLFFGHYSRDYSFGVISGKIKKKEFEFLEYNPPAGDD